MQKLLLLILAMVLVFSMTACGGNTPNNNNSGDNSTNPPASNNGGNASARNEWPDNVFTQQLPKASFKVKDTDANVTDNQQFYIITLDGSETYDSMMAYKEALQSAGYIVDEYFNDYSDSVDESQWWFDFTALNADGWKVAMGYNPETNAVNQFVITKPGN